MRIFREIISKNEPSYDEKYTSLEKCCEYFGLKSNDTVFHNALFDSYMTARLICKIYEKIDSDPILYKDFDYNQESMDSHFFVYKKQKIENNNIINSKISTDNKNKQYESNSNNSSSKKKDDNNNKKVKESFKNKENDLIKSKNFFPRLKML